LTNVRQQLSHVVHWALVTIQMDRSHARVERDTRATVLLVMVVTSYWSQYVDSHFSMC